MILLALDLEMNQPSGSVIEVGCAVGRSDGSELVFKGSWLIALPPGEALSPNIAALTGIRAEELTHPAAHALDELLALRDELGAFINPVVWGPGDAEALLKAAGRKPGPFGRRSIDAKTLYASWRMANGKPVAGGLAKAMTKFGLAFRGRKHRAADDAENTLAIYCRMLELLRDRPGEAKP